MPRPRSLTSADIAAAALAVVDRGGLSALSIRAVAGELNMGTMSLYRYFDDRHQLEALLVDHVFGSLSHDVQPGEPWRQRITELLERFRATASSHPAVVPLLLIHRSTAKNVAPWAEALLAALADAGLSGHRRCVAFRMLTSYVIGVIQTEHLGPLPGWGEAAGRELSCDEYPLLAQNATPDRDQRTDEEFRAGLSIILTGLDTTENR
ncbi:TetR/AcrR family transcriptional regulator [Phytoactinopolyspora mesophila]|uniref:TetR family transcriptional regulator n=1 Tax=Phytoactinopolyspora mesophila TaxID=2650750 RepID=A0A7K3M8S4_9ACTN|nr:TetR/AcrR family transcriptional regulator [Phytoactinopolyspora mesophila]NDL59684.1 TetR family transcriptional regulator [Phytoactinopolyspora mesophila]